MSIYLDVTKEHMIELAKLSEQQKNQRADQIEIRISKQTRDETLAEIFKPLTKNYAGVSESTKKTRKNSKKIRFWKWNTCSSQTSYIEISEGVECTSSLRHVLTLMERSQNFLKLEEKPGENVFWTGTPIKPQGRKIVKIKKRV